MPEGFLIVLTREQIPLLSDCLFHGFWRAEPGDDAIAMGKFRDNIKAQLDRSPDDLAAMKRIHDGLRLEQNDYVRGRVSWAINRAEGELSADETDAVIARATEIWHQDTGITPDDMNRLAALIEKGA